MGERILCWNLSVLFLSKQTIHCPINEVRKNSNVVTLNSIWISYLWVYEATTQTYYCISNKNAVLRIVFLIFFNVVNWIPKIRLILKARNIQLHWKFLISSSCFWFFETLLRKFDTSSKKEMKATKTQKQHN